MIKETVPFAHWSLFRCRLLWAYDQRLVKDAPAWPYMSYPTAAWLVHEGSVTLRFGSEIERFGPGTWIFPKEAKGLQELSDGIRILSLRFQAAWSYGTPIFDRSKTVALAEEEVPQLTESANALIAFVRGTFPASSHSQELEGGFDRYLGLQPVFMKWIEAYYTTLTAHGVRANTLEMLDEKVRFALQVIETRPLASPFRESELALAVGCSVSQLNKLFARQVGSTPAFLWNQRKLDAAKSELLNNNGSIKAVAYHLGFAAPEHLTRWFKKNSGHSPSEFRHLHHSGQHFPL
jgi:AraC-like DNA-binding protein